MTNGELSWGKGRFSVERPAWLFVGLVVPAGLLQRLQRLVSVASAASGYGFAKLERTSYNVAGLRDVAATLPS